MTGMDKRGGGASAEYPLYAGGPYRGVHVFSVARGVLCNVVLSWGFFQAGGGRGCRW